MELNNWASLSDTQKQLLLPQLKDIFFTSSARNEFSDQAEKEQFFWKWTHPYLTLWPEQTWLAIGSENNFDNVLLGYLMGCLHSDSCRPHFEKHLSSQLVFDDLYDQFPAHLHINLHPDSRGTGIGSKMIDRFAKACSQAGLPGLHIITSPEARNVSFYEKNKFTITVERDFRSLNLLFMGRVL